MKYSLINAFPAFLKFWEAEKNMPLEAQIDGWSKSLAEFPELLQKQIDAYAMDGVSWRTAACEHVFPFLEERLPAMRAANRLLPTVLPEVTKRAQSVLGCDMNIRFVIYVGIGCGAGWATRYENHPAVLFGLENIAECGWTNTDCLSGLTAHEIGHLAHATWRESAGLVDGSGPWWTLYSEGFAQCCEQRILGRESWHMNGGTAPGWLAACRANESHLARLYLQAVEEARPIHLFFGSWYQVEGLAQTGYYLGREILRGLEARGCSLSELAVEKNIEHVMRTGLVDLAG